MDPTGKAVSPSEQVSSRVPYDEPSHIMAAGYETTKQPKSVDLSSLGAFKVINEEDIPHAIQRQNWLKTFGIRSGPQSIWRNTGGTISTDTGCSRVYINVIR